MRIALTYLWRHRRLPDLDRPRLFTELVQRRKLTDRDPRMPELADKLAAKDFVRARLGSEWVVPTVWSGTRLAPSLTALHPVVVKSRHGCNNTAFVRNGARDWDRARVRSARWMRRTYGVWLDEWLYGQIPRGLLVERMIGDGGALPVDYKIYVFGGEATHVQVHLDRATDHRWIMHDRNWRPLSPVQPAVPRPSALDAMLAAAETLAAGFEFVRVDFYQPDRQPLFGEMSFYPGSGLDPFDPPALDAELGALWRRASIARAGTAGGCGGKRVTTGAPRVAGATAAALA